MEPTLDIESLFRELDHRARVDENELFVVRDPAPSRRIAKLLPLKRDRHWMLCGSGGTGKSSELAYLGKILEDERFVVGLDLFESVDDLGALEPVEVLLLIGAAVLRTAQELRGVRLPLEQIEGLQRSFIGVLDDSESRPETSRILGGVAVLSWAGSSLGKIQKGTYRAPLGGLTRPELRDGDSDVAALVTAVNVLCGHVREESGKEPVVLVDGLDKLDDAEAIRRLFSARLLADVGAPCVYSAPVTAVLREEGGADASLFEPVWLTSAVVSTRGEIDPELVERDRSVLREMVTRRLEKHGVEEGDLFETGALDLLITESGGVPRLLVRLAAKSIERAHLDDAVRVTVERAREAIRDLVHEYAVTMNAKLRAELESVLREGEPSGSPMSFKMLLGSYALLYGTDETWWAPAPPVARLL